MTRSGSDNAIADSSRPRIGGRRWRRLIVPLAIALVGVGLQAIPKLPFLPELAPKAKADPPTLSGAEPAYPLNHTIDGNVEEVGTPPENPDFEDPSEQVGDQPTNLDLEAAASSLATPSNNDFETGDLTGWTVTSDPSIQTTSGDDWAKLGSSDTITSSTITVPYDDAGNRLTETRDSVPTAYTYDDAGGIVSVGATSATTDDAGNLTDLGSDEYGYDYGNRLVSATANGHDATYTYDGDGMRVGSEVDSAPVDYLVDREDGLPTVVDDDSRAYLHADGLIEATGGGDLYPLTDALGSIQAITNATGNIVGTESYEVFGATRSASGTPLSFGFTGEQRDSTGGVFLRARTLAPELGRFLQADSMRPSGPGSLGLNAFAYSGSDPVSWVDRSGHSASSAFGYQAALLLIFSLTTLAAACLATGVGALVCPISAAVLITVAGWFVAAYAIAAIFECVSVPGCIDQTLDDWGFIKSAGSQGEGQLLDPADVEGAVDSLPNTPEEPDPGMEPHVPPVPFPPGLDEGPWEGQVVYRVWGGLATLAGPFWSPVDPRLLGPEKYRVKAGLPDVKNSGVLLTEARIVNPAGILVQEAASIQASGGASYCNYPGGMTEYWS